jgi:mono/diheme cytochrome c family protein
MIRRLREMTAIAAVALMTVGVGIGLSAAGAGQAAGAPAPKPPAKPAGASSTAATVARGKYLVTIAVCNDCHTPFKMGDNGPEPDMSRMLSGHPADMTLPPPPQASGPWIVSGAATFTAWSGPWGISYTANLTPDKETGLGTWTAQQFIDTIRNGRVQGHGRQLLPPMPWAWYRNMTDSDLRAVFAYLQTIPAVKNKVPDPVLAPPAK